VTAGATILVSKTRVLCDDGDDYVAGVIDRMAWYFDLGDGGWLSYVMDGDDSDVLRIEVEAL
jgi:hypothetical protein